MGIFNTVIASGVLLAASATAQVVSYTTSNNGLSVNIPSSSASSGSGPIYLQISAPSGTSWVSFGQGSRMAGSNMFVVYAASSSNVTLSTRAGTGHNMPQYDSSIQATLLGGSGVQSDGSFVANIRCDNCNSWSGGSMSFTSTSSSWIYAVKTGSALDTSDVSANIAQHGSYNSFSLDLTKGTGGSSSNPFVAAAVAVSSSAGVATSASGSGASQATGATAASQTSGAAAASTAGVSTPIAGTGSSSASSASSSSAEEKPTNSKLLRNAHGIIMSVLFVAMFPFFSLTLYLPTAKKVRYIHGPLQVVSIILLIAGMALGIVIGQRFHELDNYHLVIGFIISGFFILVQPAMGVYQHLQYHKSGTKTVFGVIHRWLGRTLILLGIVNGGLGFMLAGNTGAYVPYAVVSAIVFLIYIGVVAFAWYRARKQQDVPVNEKAGSDRSYEMSNGSSPIH